MPFQRSRRLSAEEKALLWRAARALCRTRSSLLLFPFSRVHNEVVRLPVAGERRHTPDKIVWAFDALGRRLFFFNNCLVRSLAAIRVLKSFGYDPVLSFGAMKKAPGKLDAHAWLIMDGKVLMGGVDAPFTPFEAAGAHP